VAVCYLVYILCVLYLDSKLVIYQELSVLMRHVCRMVNLWMRLFSHGKAVQADVVVHCQFRPIAPTIDQSTCCTDDPPEDHEVYVPLKIVLQS
jgi:hypothetical protein